MQKTDNGYSENIFTKMFLVVTHWICLREVFPMVSVFMQYHNNPKYWNREAFANSVDPDQMPQNVASDQGLHCLPDNNNR